MKWKALFALACITVVIACSKDKFQTRPQIKIKSMNGNIIPVGADLIIRLEFTDKEGDLGEDTLLSIRNRTNLRPLPPGGSSPDTIYNIIPEFPDKNKGELEVKYNWTTYLHQSDVENDTIFFKFVAKDRGGHVSDTVTSEQIVVLRQ